MNVEKLVEQMNEGRMINITESIFIPMFDKHIEELISTMCNQFKEGKDNFLPLVAQISYIRDMLDELRRKKIRGAVAHTKLNRGDN